MQGIFGEKPQNYSNFLTNCNYNLNNKQRKNNEKNI